MFRITTIAMCLFASSTLFGRTWVSSGGKFKTEAKLIRVEGKSVVLENPKGKQLLVPIRKLSVKDRSYVTAWLAKQPDQRSEQEQVQLRLVKGTLFGEPFEAKRTKSQGGTFTFQADDEFISREFVRVSLMGDFNERLGGRTIRITPRTKSGAPHVTMRVRKNGNNKWETLFGGYSMKLQVGPWQPDDMAVAKILLSVPKHDTKLSGSFKLQKPFNATSAPEAGDRPYVVGRILTNNIRKPNLRAGYFGVTDSGEKAGNMAGTVFNSTSGYAACTTFSPRNTSVFHHKGLNYGFKHVKLEPGRYFFYVNWNLGCVTGEWVDVKEDSEIKLTMKFDQKQSGSLDVAIPAGKENQHVTAIPLALFGDEPNPLSFARRLGISEKIQDGSVFFESLSPGRYRIVHGKVEKEVVVKADDTVSVTL